MLLLKEPCAQIVEPDFRVFKIQDAEPALWITHIRVLITLQRATVQPPLRLRSTHLDVQRMPDTRFAGMEALLEEAEIFTVVLRRSNGQHIREEDKIVAAAIAAPPPADSQHDAGIVVSPINNLIIQFHCIIAPISG